MTENIQENDGTEQPLSQDSPAEEAAPSDVVEPLEEPETGTKEEEVFFQSLESQGNAANPDLNADPDAKQTPGGFSVDDPRFEWFAIQTQSSMEKKAIQGLRQRVTKYKLQEKFGDIFAPTHTVEKIDEKGRKRKIERKVMPGYVLVQMKMDSQTYNIVKDTPRISTFIGGVPNKTPPPVSIPEVERMLDPQSSAKGTGQAAGAGGKDKNGGKSSAEIDCPFAKGDKVTVTDGPFASFQGEVDEVKADKRKLKLLISVFGRQTPVEIEFAKVEKVVD